MHGFIKFMITQLETLTLANGWSLVLWRRRVRSVDKAASSRLNRAG